MEDREERLTLFDLQLTHKETLDFFSFVQTKHFVKYDASSKNYYVVCLECNGTGKAFDPNDPSDPIEGNKMRGVINCPSCGGKKTGKLKSWMKYFQHEVLAERKRDSEQVNQEKLIASAKRKLTPEEQRAVGIFK